ncbi:hypothetical protein BT69DRAFT_761411 [Atractiella rhizophila]|nr:hypothetical protein BT69DRAFT_761411 [Atractiella rhizophila]
MGSDTGSETESEVSSEEISTPFLFNKLPLDLQLCIIELVRDIDPCYPLATLLSLSCVSKSLRELAIPFIFREFRISTASFEDWETSIFPREVDTIPSEYLKLARSVRIVLAVEHLGQFIIRFRPWQFNWVRFTLDKEELLSFCEAASSHHPCFLFTRQQSGVRHHLVSRIFPRLL